MSQSATIKSLAHAFRMMKAMQSDGIEWGDDYRRAGASALKEVLEGRMAGGIDCHLDEMARREVAGRMLTLVTCYPFDAIVPGGPLRYLVFAEADRARFNN